MSAHVPSPWFESEHPVALHSAPSAVRKQATNILASDFRPVASSAGSGYRKPPSSTVWNCDLYDGFV